jgi:hypothetical protein
MSAMAFVGNLVNIPPDDGDEMPKHVEIVNT